MEIEKAKELLKQLRTDYETEAVSRKFRGALSMTVDEDDAEAIDTILDAYEQTTDILNRLHEGELFTARQAKTMENILKKHYVHKDRIKHEIETIESNYNKKDVPRI